MHGAKRALVLSALFLALPAAGSGFPPLAPLLGTGSLGTPADPSSFVFVVAGDNRPAKSGDPQPKTLGTIVQAVQGMSPAPSFVLWAGDTISGKKPDKEKKMKGEYDEFLGIVKGAGVPVFSAPGNHELNLKADPKGCPKAIDQPDPSGNLLGFWTKFMGQPFGVFRYGSSAFLAVNTDDVVPAGVKLPKCEYNGYVGPDQLAALKTTLKDLSADPGIAHIFVFMHRPVEASPVSSKNQLDKPSRDPLKVILEDGKYPNVSFVFAAHQHLFYFHDKKNPWQTGPFERQDPAGTKPAYVVTGGAGAPLTKKATPETGGYHHYLIVQVSGAKVTVTMVKVAD
jgi:calcineurin-like phosphoesterase family protein